MFGKQSRDRGRQLLDGGVEATNEEHSHNRRGRDDRSTLGSRKPRSSHGGGAMIETLVPASACAEMFSDAPESTMFSIEAAAVAGAVAERRREFGTVRYCARKALRQIGVPAVPILPDADGAPRWPVGRGRQHDPLRGLPRRRRGAIRRAVRRRHRRRTACRAARRGCSTSSCGTRNGRGCRRWRTPTPTCTGTASCSAPRRRSTRRGSR